jgi:hypothetical protein
MDLAMGGFAAYELMHIETGIPLYRTCATEHEILEANANLKNRGLPNRFVQAGTFTAPSLHDPR